MFKAIGLFLALAAVAWPVTPAKHKAPPKRRSHAVTSHTAKPPARKAPPKSSSKTKGKPRRRMTRSYQQAPTPERYKEIQQALAGKGYFQGEPNGAWGPDSVAALQRFQADQNLAPDGKLNSLSLIALGLGPKRLSAQTSPHPPADAPR